MGSPDPEVRRDAFGSLVAVYWRPVYGYLRLRWAVDPETASDLTQEFFTEAMLRGFLADYEPGRARFRTFLRSCLDHFTANARRAEGRLKRGGGVRLLPLDFAGAEAEFARAGRITEAEAETRFQQEWVRAVLGSAVAALRAACASQGKELPFRLFERYDLTSGASAGRPTYRELAEEFGVPVTQVTNHLAWVRRELRREVLEALRRLTGSEAEFRAEARELLGMEET
jgi:RNA polymerase sigma factor (sigma-70 family)